MPEAATEVMPEAATEVIGLESKGMSRFATNTSSWDREHGPADTFISDFWPQKLLRQ